MKVNVKLSDLMEIKNLEADQEGMLRGGFSFFAIKKCQHEKSNGNCDCNSKSGICDGNGNCDCNEGCEHNCNCNCDCGTTAPSKTEPAESTNATGKSLDGMGLFMF